MKAAAELEAPEPLALKGRHTVVLIDDEPAVLASLRRLLRSEPYEVRATRSPEVALAWVEWDRVSLVVLDHRMPGICGTELAERIRRLSPRTVRVMLTGYPGNALVRQGLSEDVQWLISKPWNDHALRLTLRRLLRDLESGAPPSPGAGSEEPPDPEERKRSSSGAFRRLLQSWIGHGARGVGGAVGFLWAADAGGLSKF